MKSALEFAHVPEKQPMVVKPSTVVKDATYLCPYPGKEHDVRILGNLCHILSIRLLAFDTDTCAREILAEPFHRCLGDNWYSSFEMEPMPFGPALSPDCTGTIDELLRRHFG